MMIMAREGGVIRSVPTSLRRVTVFALAGLWLPAALLSALAGLGKWVLVLGAAEAALTCFALVR